MNPKLVTGGGREVDQVGDSIRNGGELKKMEDDPNGRDAAAMMGGGAAMESSKARYMF